MARKRGGLAGIYDRNKKLIKTVAPIAAGFIPGVGPALGAAIGAAIGGDTEGKGYFKGFNTGGAIKGGISGYGGAKLGQAAKGKLGQMFTGGVSPVDKLTGAPKLGVMTETTGPSPYGAIGSYQPPMPTDALLSSPVTRLTGGPKPAYLTANSKYSDPLLGSTAAGGSSDLAYYPSDMPKGMTGILGTTDEGKTFTSTPYKFPKLSNGFQGSTNGNSAALRPMNNPPRIGDFTQLAPDQTIESTFGRRPYYNPPTPTLPSGAGRFTGSITSPTERFRLADLGSLFGKEGKIEQNKTILSGIGKGVMAERAGSREDEQARLQMAENARMFDEQQKLRVRQQANLDQESMMTKQQLDELNANRAKLRALLTGGM
jgi:hypothetical protein